MHRAILWCIITSTYTVSVVVVLLPTATTAAIAQPFPATLAAAGWLQLFDGKTLFGWQADAGVTVQEGCLQFPRGQPLTARPTSRFGEMWELRLEVAGPVRLVFAGGLELEHRGAEANILRVKCQAGDITWDGTGFTARRMTEGLPAEGWRIAADGTAAARVRNVSLLPLGLEPLFDGKTLGGWKVNAADPKRMRSQFAVTSAGELAVKDGPGDLVSERAFADFVLQLQCRTQGRHLNSGIFFRCVPGQYQNGYEAQIHNGYRDNDRTRPIDFGTGAIYRRVPARKVVSDDGEWFTLTVLADGRHIATWVNGYPVVDWTDPRPPHENPRQGYRAAAGPISIQGHDPTTDILFRNIRIRELPPRKEKREQ